MANTLSERLKFLREERNWSQEFAAKKLEIHVITLSNYENNKRTPDKKKIEKFAEVYDVPVEWLMSGNPLFRTKESIEAYRKYADSSKAMSDRLNLKLMEADPTYVARSGHKVQIVGNMPAGAKIDILDEEPKGEMWLPFPDVKDCVAFTITGNSMENLYYAGDIVIVRPRSIDQDIHDGNIYGLDYRIDDQLYRTVKYVYHEGREAFRLRSKNGSHKDIVVKEVIRFYRIIREIRGFTDQLA